MLCFTLTVRGSFIKEKEADIAMDDEKCFFFILTENLTVLKKLRAKAHPDKNCFPKYMRLYLCLQYKQRRMILTINIAFIVFTNK